jgi:hypothetical protein
VKETALEAKLRKAVERAGGFCLKLPSQFYRGIPDRLILLPGARIIFVELKAEKGRVKEVQYAFQKILQGLGFTSLIIRGIQETEEFIDAHLKV